MEEALWDRVSFKRFVGLSLEDAAPDHSTISRFRKEVAKRGLGRRLFEELGRQLDERGLLVKKGTLLDATIVEAQVKRPAVVARLGGEEREGPGRGLDAEGRDVAFRIQGARGDGRWFGADP